MQVNLNTLETYIETAFPSFYGKVSHEVVSENYTVSISKSSSSERVKFYFGGSNDIAKGDHYRDHDETALKFLNDVDAILAILRKVRANDGKNYAEEQVKKEKLKAFNQMVCGLKERAKELVTQVKLGEL